MVIELSVQLACVSVHSSVLVVQSCLTLCVPWTVAHKPPLSVGFSRQEYWSALPFPSPGYLPDTGIKPKYPALHADSLPLSSLGRPHLLEWPKSIKLTKTNNGENIQQQEHSLIAERNGKWYNHFGRHFGNFLQS